MVHGRGVTRLNCRPCKELMHLRQPASRSEPPPTDRSVGAAGSSYTHSRRGPMQAPSEGTEARVMIEARSISGPPPRAPGSAVGAGALSSYAGLHARRVREARRRGGFLHARACRGGRTRGSPAHGEAGARGPSTDRPDKSTGHSGFSADRTNDRTKGAGHTPLGYRIPRGPRARPCSGLRDRSRPVVLRRRAGKPHGHWGRGLRDRPKGAGPDTSRGYRTEADRSRRTGARHGEPEPPAVGADGENYRGGGLDSLNHAHFQVASPYRYSPKNLKRPQNASLSR